jgi:DNA primase
MVIAYDSDNAGFKASERAWGMALALGMDIKLAPISQGKDPADVIKESPENWKTTIKNSKHIIEVLIDKIKNTEVSDREKGQLISERIIPYLSQIKSDIDRDHFVKKVSESFNLREDVLIAEMKHQKEINKEEKFGGDSFDESSRLNRSKDEMAVEKRLFGIMYSQESSKNPTINPKELQDKIREILEKDYDFVTEKIKTVIDEIIYAAENTFENKDKLEKEIKELLANLNLKYLNRKREKLVLELKRMEMDKNEEEENRLLTEISEISKKIQKISQSL